MPSHRFRTPFHIYIVPGALTRKPVGFGRVHVFRPSRSQAEQIIRKAVRQNRREAMSRLRGFVSSQVPGSVSKMNDRRVRKRAARCLARCEVWRHSTMPAYVNGSPATKRKKASEQESSATSTAAATAPPDETLSITDPQWVHASESAAEARPGRAEGGDDVVLRATTSGAQKGEAVTFELFNETEDPSAPVERVTGKVVETTGDQAVAEATWTVSDLRRGSGGQEITFRATCKGESTKRAALPMGFVFGRALSRTRQPRENWPFAIYEKGASGSPVHEGTTIAGGQIVAPFPYADSYVVRPRRV